MKFTMYISILCSLLPTLLAAEPIEYNLLDSLPSDTYDITPDGINGTDSFNIKNTTLIDIPVDSLTIGNQTITVPFIIESILKFDESLSYACLFTMYDEEKKIIELCFALVHKNHYVSMNLLVWPERIRQGIIKIPPNVWSKILIFVEKDRFRVFHNCNEAKYKESNVGDFGEAVAISQTSRLKVGYNPVKAPVHGFNGAIQELKIISNADMSLVKAKCPNIITCDCSAGLVSSVLQSLPEMKGFKGEPGSTGYDGTPGPRGLTGNQGPQGPRGVQGAKGEMGVRGYDGPPGREGSSGPKGEPGKDGEPGPRGLMGPPGPPGSVIENGNGNAVVPGPRGEQGPLGPEGLPGKQGERGFPGERGTDGVDGRNGDPGPPGPRGLAGEKGDRGLAGINGVPGEPGLPGAPAPMAEKGVKGDKGERGQPGSLKNLLSDELDPQEYAAIVEKIRGFNLKGEPGDSCKEKGNVTISSQGSLDGKDGSSEVPGSEGSAGLKGVKGDQGAPGPPGPPGMGIKGEPGKPGRKGCKGPAGRKGAMGHAGRMGIPGFPGINGTKGEKGDSGDCTSGACMNLIKGDKGEMGVVGLPGLDGMPGLPGPQGPPGTCPSTCRPRNELDDYTERPTFPNEDQDPGETEGFQGKMLIYTSTKTLFEQTSKAPVGTLAFAIKEELLLLRVKSGWKNIAMNSLTEEGSSVSMELTDTQSLVSPVTQNPVVQTISDPSIDSKVSPKIELIINPPPVTQNPVWDTTSGPPMNLASRDTPNNELTIVTESPAFSILEQDPVIQSSDSESTLNPFNLLTEDPFSTSRPIFKGPPVHPIQRNTVRVVPPKLSIRLVALNDPYDGACLETTKISCIEQARNSLNDSSVTFVPFLSLERRNVSHLVRKKYWDLPVVNFNYELLFYSWESMFDGSEANIQTTAEILSFSNKNVASNIDHWPYKLLWHGSNSYGERLNRDNLCDQWKQNKRNHYGRASLLPNILGQQRHDCSSKFIVLCVEQLPKKLTNTRHARRSRRHHRRPNHDN